ncbi:hypothetical protein OIE13_23575 [Streptosporangium sp. NBC_01810]|uniref:hypothetical protein n=1 Tax=Streptosporangium sp. NBC_01810 TaxID=2975951 RepID=UPI002DDA7EDE|nr:hypothetical protein [Streptosporangium sp. NBC_01810]WSA23920.1 hypothetical protein OIE13_23575 [Streptosporangium sp. NBC_01810]
MGKFEGMDPKLVRDLLSEVRRAADQMRNAEGKVTQLMSGAGLSSQSTHRPVQIADACDVMVRDVSARVALLEKKINQNVTAPPAEPRAGDTKPDSGSAGDGAKPETGAAGDDAKPETPKADGLKPAVGADDKPRVGDQSAESTQRDDPKDSPKPETGSKGDVAKPETPKADEAKPETGSKGDETSPRDGSKETPKPETSGADERKPETGSKGDETSPRGEDTPKESVKPVDTAPREAPKPDAMPEAPRADDTPREAPKADPTPVPEAPKPDAMPEAPRADDTPREAPKADPTPEAPRAEGARPETPKVEDLEPAVPGPGEGPQDGGRPVDGVPRETPVPEAPSPDAAPVPEVPQGDSTPAPETPRSDDARPEIVNVNDTMPGGEDSDAKGDSGSKGDETTPRGDGSVGDTPVNDPDAKGDSGSKGDERSPRQESGTSGNDILDSSKKDHPDDIDQSGDHRARVVEVDGVQVLQIPLDSPTAAEVDELLKNIEDIPPLEMPGVDNVSATAGQPGWVEPHGPLDSAKPDYPLLDTAGPTTDQTVQPPGTGGDATPQPAGTASGEAAVRPPATTSAEPAVQTAGTTTSGEAASQPAVAPRGDVGMPSIGDAVFSEARGAEDAAGGAGQAAGVAPGGVAAPPDGGPDEGSVARWAGDGSDVVTAEAGPLDLDALRTLADNAREIEPLEMPGVQVPDGETWGKGAWAPMDIGPDGPAGDVEPGNPLRPIPPPGGGQ